MSWPVELLAYGTSAPIRRITSFSAKFTDAPLAEGKFETYLRRSNCWHMAPARSAKFIDAPLAEGKFETYLHERENAKKPRAVRLSRPRLPMINCSAARTRLIDPRWSETLTKS